MNSYEAQLQTIDGYDPDAPRTHIMDGTVRLCLAEAINGEVCQRVAGHSGKHSDLKTCRWKDNECRAARRPSSERGGE